MHDYVTDTLTSCCTHTLTVKFEYIICYINEKFQTLLGAAFGRALLACIYAFFCMMQLYMITNRAMSLLVLLVCYAATLNTVTGQALRESCMHYM